MNLVMIDSKDSIFCLNLDNCTFFEFIEDGDDCCLNISLRGESIKHIEGRQGRKLHNYLESIAIDLRW